IPECLLLLLYVLLTLQLQLQPDCHIHCDHHHNGNNHQHCNQSHTLLVANSCHSRASCVTTASGNIKIRSRLPKASSTKVMRTACGKLASCQRSSHSSPCK